MRWFKRKPRHQHEWRYIGTTFVGWSLYRCPCGEVEIG